MTSPLFYFLFMYCRSLSYHCLVRIQLVCPRWNTELAKERCVAITEAQKAHQGRVKESANTTLLLFVLAQLTLFCYYMELMTMTGSHDRNKIMREVRKSQICDAPTDTHKCFLCYPINQMALVLCRIQKLDQYFKIVVAVDVSELSLV